MNQKTRGLFTGIISILFIYIVLMTCIDTIALNRHFYNWQHDTLHTSEKVKMSKIDLYESMDVLLDYLEGNRDSIDLEVKVNGNMREVYTTREKKHMVDVKYLYQDAMLVRNVAVGVVLFLGIILYADNKKKMMYALCKSYSKILMLFFMFIGTLLIYALSDFTRFWTAFHQLFFDNDLWLLDPRSSIMINMLEESLFSTLVFMIAGVFLFILLVMYVFSRKYVKNYIEL